MARKKTLRAEPRARAGMFGVEGRQFDNERHAVSFAYALACEYGRHINVYLGCAAGVRMVGIVSQVGRIA